MFILGFSGPRFKVLLSFRASPRDLQSISISPQLKLTSYFDDDISSFTTAGSSPHSNPDLDLDLHFGHVLSLPQLSSSPLISPTFTFDSPE